MDLKVDSQHDCVDIYRVLLLYIMAKCSIFYTFSYHFFLVTKKPEYFTSGPIHFFLSSLESLKQDMHFGLICMSVVNYCILAYVPFY